MLSFIPGFQEVPTCLLSNVLFAKYKKHGYDCDYLQGYNNRSYFFFDLNFPAFAAFLPDEELQVTNAQEGEEAYCS